MPLKDLIQSQFTAADITAINTALNSIEDTIAGKTVNLTPEERQRYGSINEQNKLLVNRINDFSSSHPQFNAAQVNWEEFLADYSMRQTLDAIQHFSRRK